LTCINENQIIILPAIKIEKRLKKRRVFSLAVSSDMMNAEI